MFKKESKVYAILNNRCPRCHEGPVFKSKNPFHPTRFYQMYDSCVVCEQTYEPEVGFYYGSMFLSYIVVALLIFAMTFGQTLILGYTLMKSWIISVVIIAFLWGFFYRFSRSLWLNIYVPYRGKKK